MPPEITAGPARATNPTPTAKRPGDWLTSFMLGGGALIALIILTFMYPDYRVNRYVVPVDRLLAAGDYKALVPHLQGAIKYKRRVNDFTFLLGDSYLRLGDYQQALQAFEAAQKLSPSTRGLECIGSCLYELGKKDEAKTYFSQVLSKDPKSAIANYYLARDRMAENGKFTPDSLSQIAMELALPGKGSTWEAKAQPLRKQLLNDVMGSDVGSATKYLAAITTGTTQTQPLAVIPTTTTSTAPIDKP
jgi:tetratricopeptide (TPR) repeat protein